MDTEYLHLTQHNIRCIILFGVQWFAWSLAAAVYISFEWLSFYFSVCSVLL